MSALETWPSLSIIALFVGVFATSMALAPLLGERVFRGDGPARHKPAFEAMTMIGSLTAIFLSFALVQSMGEYRRAESAVAHEAGDLLQLDRALSLVPEGGGQAARQALREYARAIVALEWPAMRNGRGAVDAARASFSTLQVEIERMVRGMRSEQAGLQILRSLDDVHDDRTGRLGSAGASLPPLLWWAAAGLLGLVLLSAAGVEATRYWMTMTASYGAALAVLAACFYILDGPFMGDVSVSPRPIALAVSVLEERLH